MPEACTWLKLLEVMGMPIFEDPLDTVLYSKVLYSRGLVLSTCQYRKKKV